MRQDKNKTFLLAAFFLILFSATGQAAKYSSPPSITGVKTAKIYFDVNIGTPQKLLLRLSLIEETLSQLQAQGIIAEAIIGFRGGASRFVTKGDDYIDDNELSEKIQVHHWLESFAEKGIHMEQCLIAAELNDIAPADFRPELTLAENGYIAMILYQNQGFALVPMD